jgi:hypothetical protein
MEAPDGNVRIVRLVRGRFTGPLTFSGLGPPGQIVGKAGEDPLKLLSSFTNGLTSRVQGLRNGSDGQRARDHNHTHLGKGPVPKEIGTGAR